MVKSAYSFATEKEKIEQNIFELGGPETFSFKELMEILLKQIKKKRFLLSIPWGIARYQAKFLEIFTKTILTEDQILLLQDCDSVVTGHYPGLKDLNINGMTVETVLPDYIFRFRDSGQFNRD